MLHLWHQMRHYGLDHGVDPLVFAAVYLARLPLLLAAMAVMVQRIRRRRSATTIAVIWLALGVIPYLYILLFGHGLPAWLIAAVVAIITLTFIHAARQLRALRIGARDAVVP